ncbi:MAG: TonB-dependent receptor domain-containing protein [Asticcacaulis sp.]|uniref:TonB-dependent receptor domain-containing protein n=1 Tax=Asticcacaulis sp. TaxID=1872648 RepID=UPI003F7CA8D3
MTTHRHSLLAGGASALVLAALISASPAAAAQDAPAAPAAKDKPAAQKSADDLGQVIIVTASGRDKTKMQSSMSISTVSLGQINDFTPRSEAEVFRLIPGIQAQDTAGPGGNSNISVRGIPVVTGGSEFVQLQEDGLPTVLFGDMNFGNNDYWTRYDSSVARIEAVRGGGASTFASQAPGAVINYVSDTGGRDGGVIALNKALGYNETKIDYAYGGHLSDTLRFHIGGFVKDGSGPTHIGYNAEQGYQFKGNITKDLDGGKGYIRLNVKRLDDKEPTYTTAPSLASVSGDKITGFSVLPGFDARKNSNQSIYNQSFQVLQDNGQLTTVPMEGIHVKSTSIGGEFHYDFSDNFSVHDALRWTDQSGAFRTQFVNVATTSSILGSSVNGQTVGSIVYANGPKQGQVFTGAYVNNNPNIDTEMPDMGSFVNDLTLTGKTELGAGKLTAKAGWFHMRQSVVQDWHVNRQYNELSGDNPAQLDLFSGPNGTGVQLTAAGQAGFNDNWGSCCSRSYDLSYVDDAGYLALDYLIGQFDIDASLRQDTMKASGWAKGGVAGPNVTVTDNLGSATLPSLVANGPMEVLNYGKSYTSYSVGLLYSLNPDTSLFARVSRGGRFNADRQILGGNFNADGTLNAQGATTAVNFIDQQEAGLKRKGAIGDVVYNVEATYFRAQLTDNNYDFTRITLGLNPVISNVYHSDGLEMSGNLRWGNFSLYSDATTVNAKIVATGKVPHATPKLTFLISPTWDAGGYALGASINGQTATWVDDANTYKVIGQTYVNGFVKFRPYKGLELAINANNIFNTLGYRGSGSLLPISASQGVFQNSAVLGRTVTASIRYRF